MRSRLAAPGLDAWRGAFMLNITVAAESAASPERVLALAGTDFSARRAKVWGNVKEGRLAVHERGATHVEVTEYGTGPAWFAWERSRYDWSATLPIPLCRAWRAWRDTPSRTKRNLRAIRQA